jgi:hypothetical protein
MADPQHFAELLDQLATKAERRQERVRGRSMQPLAPAMILAGCRSSRCRGNDRFPDTRGPCRGVVVV